MIGNQNDPPQANPSLSPRHCQHDAACVGAAGVQMVHGMTEMRIITILFLAVASTSSYAEEVHLAPIAWCTDGFMQWAEYGTVCHTNLADRKPPICMLENEADQLTEGTNSQRAQFNGVCSVPLGFSASEIARPIQR